MSEYGYIAHSELYHHGVKGQRWGIRRYQNEDGSYKSGAEGRYYHPIRSLIRGVHSIPRKITDSTRASVKRAKQEEKESKVGYRVKNVAVGYGKNKVKEKIKSILPEKKEKKVVTQESELAAKRAKMRKAAATTAGVISGIGTAAAVGLGTYKYFKGKKNGKDIVNRALQGLASGKAAGQIGSNAISNIKRTKNIKNTVAQLTGSIKGAKNTNAQLKLGGGKIYSQVKGTNRKGSSAPKAFLKNTKDYDNWSYMLGQKNGRYSLGRKEVSDHARAMLVGNPNLTDYSNKRNKLVAKYAKKAYKQYKKSTK